MSKLDLEVCMKIKTLARQRVAQREIAHMLGISLGTVRYQIRRMEAGEVDGRSAQPMRAEALAMAIAYWGEQTAGAALNLASLRQWLVNEHGYHGRLRSVQRYWQRIFPAPVLRARRRVDVSSPTSHTRGK